MNRYMNPQGATRADPGLDRQSVREELIRHRREAAALIREIDETLRIRGHDMPEAGRRLLARLEPLEDV